MVDLIDAPAVTAEIVPGPPRKLRAAKRRKTTVTRWVVMVLLGIFMIVPLLGLFDFSSRLLNGTRKWDAWAAIAHPSRLDALAPGLLDGLKTTLLLAVITAAATVLLLVPTMTWIRLRVPQLVKLVEFICLLPLAIPAIVLVVGLGPVYQQIAHLFSTASIWLWFVYVILALPYAYRAIDAGLRSIDVKTLSEAARSLGSSWVRVMWSVVLPNIRSGVIGAVFLTVALVLGEFTVAQLLSKNNLAVAVGTLGLNSSGNPRLTAVIALLTLLLGFVLMFGFSFVGNGPREPSRRSRRAAMPAAPLSIPAPAGISTSAGVSSSTGVSAPTGTAVQGSTNEGQS